MAYKLASDLDRWKRLPIGMIGGGRGSFFAPYHRAALRLSGRWSLDAGVFSSDRPRSIEAAQALGVSTATAESDWAYARCWLRLEIEGGEKRSS